MAERFAWRLAISTTLVLFLLGGYGTHVFPPQDSVQLERKKFYVTYIVPTKTQINAEVVWVESREESAKLCGVEDALGCRVKTEEGEVLVVQRPRSFNDALALQVLGHEVLHSLGAQHE